MHKGPAWRTGVDDKIGLIVIDSIFPYYESLILDKILRLVERRLD